MEKLRIILTEECDLACCYCRRTGNAAQAERSSVLAAAKGAERVELAGGESLLWPDICGLVRELKSQPGTDWVGLTTNGTRLAPLVPELAKAGLDGVNLHLDTCNAFDFAAITGREQVMNDILNGLWAAVAHGIPVTISSVLLPETLPQISVMGGLAKQYELTVRFVSLPGLSPGREEALSVLSRYIKHLEPDGEVWRSNELRGCITFGCEIPGAFGMEGCETVSFGEEKREGQP